MRDEAGGVTKYGASDLTTDETGGVTMDEIGDMWWTRLMT